MGTFTVLKSIIVLCSAGDWGVRNSKGRLFKRNLLKLDRGLVNLWALKISSLAGHFKKTNAFLVYAIWFHETVHDKWCLHKNVLQTNNGLERTFVKHWLNSV